MLTQLETRYVELWEKAIHIPLTDEEYKETLDIDEELGFKPCHSCEGTGVHIVPGMMGGWEQYNCVNCEGTGYINLTEWVHNQVKSEEF